MTAKEIIKALSKMPDEVVFVKLEKGNSKHIKSIELCDCESEIFIELAGEDNV